MSPSTSERLRNRPTPAVLTSQLRSPRRNARRSLAAYGVGDGLVGQLCELSEGDPEVSPASRAVC